MEIPAPDQPREYCDHRIPYHDEMAFLTDDSSEIAKMSL
jgi:hypothetical protein